jgi:hypothetical protein
LLGRQGAPNQQFLEKLQHGCKIAAKYLQYLAGHELHAQRCEWQRKGHSGA